MRWPALLLVTTLVLPLGGCCSMARLFCGPDRSPWVSVDFRTPELAARTLLEALRRDQPEVVYDSLSDDLRTRMGFDGLTLQVAWPKIREQYPYLHVAGYAEVPAAEPLGDNAARLTVDVEGNRLQLTMVRETFWELRYRRPGAGLAPEQRDARVGKRLTSLAGAVTIQLDEEAEDDRSTVSVDPQSVGHFGVDQIPLENVESVGVTRAWKVTAIDLIEG